MTTKLSKDFPPIRYFGPFAPNTGYNTAARGLLQVFRVLGLGPGQVRCVPLVTLDHTSEKAGVDDWLTPYIYPPVERDAAGNPKKTRFSLDEEPINLVHAHPFHLGQFWTGGRYNIAYTVWETDKLPVQALTDPLTQKSYTCVDAMNKFDEVWVPSQWNVEVFKACGVTAPVMTVPHALLPEVLDHALAPAGGDDSVDFYSMGTWTPRKDMQLLLTLYWGCGFNIMSGVDLQLYCTPPTQDRFQIEAHAWRAMSEYRQLKEMLPNQLGSAPCSGPQTVPVPYRKWVERHFDGDCYVTASHGEGFGLPLLEALAMGRWVIGGGPWVVELSAVAGEAVEVIPTTKGPITPAPEVKGYELGQQWWNVDHETFKEALVATRAELAEGPASLDSAILTREAFSPETIAKVVRSRLEAAADVASRSGW